MQKGVPLAKDPAYLDPTLPIKERVRNLLEQMTLAEKIGQMTQVDSNALHDKADIQKYALGSVLSGGGGGVQPQDIEDRCLRSSRTAGP